MKEMRPRSFSWGRLFLAGFAVARNEHKALELFKQSAEQGNSKAQFAIASAYYHGIGVTVDLQQAYYWWSLAYEGGEKQAKEFRDQVEHQLKPDEVIKVRAALAQHYVNVSLRADEICCDRIGFQKKRRSTAPCEFCTISPLFSTCVVRSLAL